MIYTGDLWYFWNENLIIFINLQITLVTWTKYKPLIIRKTCYMQFLLLIPIFIQICFAFKRWKKKITEKIKLTLLFNVSARLNYVT